MKTIISCFALLLLFSCTRETIIKQPSSPSVGIISGKVLIANSNDPYSNLGVRVSLPDLNRNTLTDSYGVYSIRNIPPGSYTITFQKEGYGERKIYDVISSGFGETKTYATFLYKNPAFTFDSLIVTLGRTIAGKIDTSYSLHLDFKNKNPDKEHMAGVLVFGTSPDVSINSNDCLYTIPNSTIPVSSSITTDITTLIQDLLKRGVHKGDIIYIKFYPCNNNAKYADSKLGKTIYPAIGSPASASFKIPE